MSKLITAFAVFAASVALAQSQAAIAGTFETAATSEFSAAAKRNNTVRHASAPRVKQMSAPRTRQVGASRVKHSNVPKQKHTAKHSSGPRQKHTARHTPQSKRTNAPMQSATGTTHVNKKHTQAANKPLQQGPNTKQVNKMTPGPKQKGVAIVDKWGGWRAPKTIVVIRDPRRIWIGDGWRTFPVYTAIGLWTFAGATLFADGYVNVASNACYGPTDDGCRLRWQELTFAEGGSDYQCVKYCKTRTAGGPVRLAEDDDQTTGAVSVSAAASAAASTGAAASAGSTPAAEGACDLTIYEHPNFKGMAAANQEDRPTLEDSGWKDAISSIEVKSGIWDFFTEDNYRGEAMRLKPGQYATLHAFSQKIGSLMCNRSVASR